MSVERDLYTRPQKHQERKNSGHCGWYLKDRGLEARSNSKLPIKKKILEGRNDIPHNVKTRWYDSKHELCNKRKVENSNS